MDLLQAAILGLVQGVTEYLPVSSSGHLVLVPAVMGWQKPPFAFDILVQLGTLVGVLIYYAKDLVAITRDFVTGIATGKPWQTANARFGWYIILATIPAAILGILFEDVFEAFFQDPVWTGAFLWLTAALLISAEIIGKRVREDHDIKDPIVIGLAQALALLPGVSRSGSTIAAGMWLGLTRERAARFSFVMSIPVMLGAGVLAGKRLVDNPAVLEESGAAIALGFGVAAISGYLVIRWFLNFVKHQSLYWFAGYCAIVGTLAFFFL